MALALSLVIAAPAQQAQPGTRVGIATIDILDVGQGDAILIRSPEDKTALIDAGPTGDVVRLLRERGSTTSTCWRSATTTPTTTAAPPPSSGRSRPACS